MEEVTTEINPYLTAFKMKIDSQSELFDSNPVEAMVRVLESYDQFHQQNPTDPNQDAIDPDNESTTIVEDLWERLDSKQRVKLVPMMLNELTSSRFSYQYIAIVFFIHHGQELIDNYYVFLSSHWDKIITALFILSREEDSRGNANDARLPLYMCAHEALSGLLIPISDRLKGEEIGRLIKEVFEIIFCNYPYENSDEWLDFIQYHYQLIFAKLIAEFQSYPPDYPAKIRSLLEERLETVSLALREKPDINLHEDLVDAIACHIIEKNKTLLPTVKFKEYALKNPHQNYENNGFFRLFTACYEKLSTEQKIMLLRGLPEVNKEGEPRSIKSLLELDTDTFISEADLESSGDKLICSIKDYKDQIIWRIYKREENYLLFERHTIGALNNYWVQTADCTIKSLSDNELSENQLSILGALHLAEAQNNGNNACIWNECHSLISTVRPLLQVMIKENPVSMALINLHVLTKAEIIEWLASFPIDRIKQLISEASDAQRLILKKIINDKDLFHNKNLRESALQMLKSLYPQDPGTLVAVMMKEIESFENYPTLKASFYSSLSEDFRDQTLNVAAVIDLLCIEKAREVSYADSFEEEEVHFKRRDGYLNSTLTQALKDSRIILNKAQAKELISFIESKGIEFPDFFLLIMEDIFIFLHTSASQETSIIPLIFHSLQNIKQKIADSGLRDPIRESTTREFYKFYMVLLNSLHTKNQFLEVYYSKCLDNNNQWNEAGLKYHLFSMDMCYSKGSMLSWLPSSDAASSFEGFEEMAKGLIARINNVKKIPADKLLDESNILFFDHIKAIKSRHEKGSIIREQCEHIDKDYQNLEQHRESVKPSSNDEEMHHQDTKINLTEQLGNLSTTPLTDIQSGQLKALTCIRALMCRSYQVSPLVKLFFRDNRDIGQKILRFLDDRNKIKLLSLNHLIREEVFLRLKFDKDPIITRGITLFTNNPKCLFFKQSSYKCDNCKGTLWETINSEGKLNP